MELRLLAFVAAITVAVLLAGSVFWITGWRPTAHPSTPTPYLEGN